MWLVKEVGKEGGLLCRTEMARDSAIKLFADCNTEYEVVETNVCEIADPMEQ